jgi:hypothetical protein
MKLLLQPKFVDVAIFRYTGWDGTERAKDFVLIVASRRGGACEAGASREKGRAADQFR